MPNNCLSVLYKRIIQVENKNVGLKVGGGGGGGHKHTIAPPIKKVGGHMPPLFPLPTPVNGTDWAKNILMVLTGMYNILMVLTGLDNILIVLTGLDNILMVLTGMYNILMVLTRLDQ